MTMAFGGCLFFSLLLSTSNAANILIYAPTLSYSHVAFNGKLADLLVTAGHRVVLLLIEIDPHVSTNGSAYANVRRVDVDMQPDSLMRTTLWTNPGPFENSNPLHTNIVIKLIRVASILIDACRSQAENIALINDLRTYRFDIGMLEQYDSCGFGIFEALQIRAFVWLSATAIFRPQPTILGIDYPLSFIPELFSPFNDRMTFIERLHNLLIAHVTDMLYTQYLCAAETAIFRRNNGANFPHISFISSRSQLTIVNSMSTFDFPTPSLNNILYTGGFTVTDDDDNQNLSEEWMQIVERSSSSNGAGFVLISFGSIAKLEDMPNSMRRDLFQVLLETGNITFIVKYKTDDLIERYAPNIYMSKWLPQVQLMAHRNCRGVLMHGGWSGIIESLHYETPMLIMPLFADHYKNAKVIEKRNVGIIIDKLQMDRQTLATAMNRLLADNSYKQNAKRYNQMLKDIPVSLENRIVHGVSFAQKMSTNRFPNTPMGNQLRSYEYNCIDLMLIVIGIVVFISYENK